MKALRTEEEDGAATVIRNGHAELGNRFTVTAYMCGEPPKFQAMHCMLCMACLQHCPAQSIARGKLTTNRARCVFPSDGTVTHHPFM